jgi:hypothetical protein
MLDEGPNRFQASGMRPLRIGNDFRVSHGKIDQSVLDIWLVVDSSSSKLIKKDEQIFIPSSDAEDACCVLQNR